MLAWMMLTAAVSGATAGPGDRTCDRRIASAIAAGASSGVPAACWRVGALRIGMSAGELQAVMGPPVQTGELTDDLGAHHH